jgi:Aspartyl/Asparaginyl beta-hydroxylase/MYND finger
MVLELFSDWSVCDACGLPPKDGDGGCDKEAKLSVCRNCKSAAYHNVDCQRRHWTRVHRRECQQMALALQPLLQLMAACQCRCRWWTRLRPQDRQECDRTWQSSVEQWKKEDYLGAMEGFQASLQPFLKIWNSAYSTTTTTTASNGEEESFALILARRLLFCAYCEADGNQLESSRIRLAQCLSILLETTKEQDSHSEILNDAWMELMLSYEEVPTSRRMARHVASLAITSGKSCCGWTNPWQRPGYMANIIRPLENCPSFIPRDRHPEWCHMLEESWESIAQELSMLESTQGQSWSAVGSGERGSGSDDHRVVSAGGNWKEYVLFGTGGAESDRDAPITKRLLREHVPSAVSLAETGGGEVIFSRLAPGTHIEAHCGPTNLRWTAHLGLVVPPPSTGTCQIRVASTWYQWQTGKILLFDDSYEHEIRNDTNQHRTVLLLRVWHPSLSREQRMADLNEARRRKEISVEKRYHPPA